MPPVGLAYAITDTVFDTFGFANDVLEASKTGYELKILSNNPSDMDKGRKLNQREWYTSRGYEDQYWKTDSKQKFFK